MSTNHKAIVVGVSGRGAGNIGDTTAWMLRDRGWYVEGHSVSEGGYLPNVASLAKFDAVVCSLGRTAISPLHRLREEVVDDVIRANLGLQIRLAKRFIEARGADGGTVVFVGSYAHDHVLSNSIAYCAAKAGLAHAVKCLAWDYGSDFRFHVVHPYHVADTPMGEAVIEQIMDTKRIDRESAIRYQEKDLRNDRALKAVDVADAIASLLSEEWGWANGTGINLYGGVR